MTRTPRITGKKMIAVLRRAGFVVARTRGSHSFLQHSDGRRTVIPVHRGEIIGRGLFQKILHDVELSLEEFQKLM